MPSLPTAEGAGAADRHEAIAAARALAADAVPATLVAHIAGAGAAAAVHDGPNRDGAGLLAAAVARFHRERPGAFAFFHDADAGGDAAEPACLHRRLLYAIRTHCGLSEPLPDTAEALHEYLANWLARAGAGGALIAVSGCEQLLAEGFDLGQRHRPPGLRIVLASTDPAALPADWPDWEAPELPNGQHPADVEAALTELAETASAIVAGSGLRLLALLAAARAPAELGELARALELTPETLETLLAKTDPLLQIHARRVHPVGAGVCATAERLAGGTAMAAAHRQWASLHPADAAWHLSAAGDDKARNALLESPDTFTALARGRAGDLLDGWPRERIAAAALASADASGSDAARLPRIEVAVEVLAQLDTRERLDNLLRTVVELRERMDGDGAPPTATALDRWGAFRLERGDHDGARPLLERAHAIRAAALGEQHPDTAATAHRIAVLHEACGDTDAAEQAYRDALARAEAAPDPAAVLPHLANLAALRRARGALETAEPLYRRALKLAEEHLGPDHPATAAACDNLGGCLYAGHDFEGAEQQYRRGLEITERAFGPAHEATGAALHNLATTLDARQRFRDAEEYFRRALELRRAGLGEDHENTLSTLHNLAAVLESTGRVDEAEAHYRQAVAGWERLVGHEHPATATSVNNLADLLRERCAFDEAETLYQRNIETWRHLVGDEHPNTLMTIGELGGLYADAGRHDRARPLLEHAVEATRRVMGSQTLPHIDAVCRLAAVLQSDGETPAARQLLEDTVAAAEGTLGIISPRVQKVRRCLEALDSTGAA